MAEISDVQFSFFIFLQYAKTNVIHHFFLHFYSISLFFPSFSFFLHEMTKITVCIIMELDSMFMSIDYGYKFNMNNKGWVGPKKSVQPNLT